MNARAAIVILGAAFAFGCEMPATEAESDAAVAEPDAAEAIDASEPADADVAETCRLASADAGTKCRALKAEWDCLMASMSEDCEGAGDCLVVGGPAYTCDCVATLSGCGTGVNRESYERLPRASVVANIFKRDCENERGLNGACDCTPMQPRCTAAGKCGTEWPAQSCY